MTISENIAIISKAAAEMDSLISKFRAAKLAMDAAEASIRRDRPASEPSRAYQERLANVAIDMILKPSIAGNPTISELASKAWAGVK